MEVLVQPALLRNARNLQELELNWLAVLFKDGKAEKAFISLVKNP